MSDTAAGPVDLAGGSGKGPLWGTASADLNATLLAWPPGHATPDHVNEERDVLVVVIDGTASADVGGTGHELRAPAAMIIPKGARRRITAGPDGVRYLTAHVVRPGLRIGRA